LFGSRLNVVWQFVLHIPRDVARTVELVWQLPINIRAGPDLEFNWSILPINISILRTGMTSSYYT
jgi:hypothetical protein